MSNTILISLHIIVALFTSSWAFFLLVTNFKNPKARAVSFLLVLNALSSFSYAFELNSFASNQIIIWTIIEFFVATTIPALSTLAALYLFRPQVIKKWWVSLLLWTLIISPLVISLMDGSRISSVLFNTHLFFNVDQMLNTYTGGYLSIGDAGTGPLYAFANYQLIILFAIFIIYPLTYVVIKDRKAKPFYSHNALVLLIISIIVLIVQSVFQNILPPTISTMIANFLFASGFFIVAFRIIMDDEVEEGEEKPNENFFNLFQNFRIGAKIIIGVATVLIPAIIVIGFTTSSLFKNSLVSESVRNLSSTAFREAQLISSTFDSNFTQMSELKANSIVQSLVSIQNQKYAGLTEEAITEVIAYDQINWQNENSLVVVENSTVILIPEIEYMAQTNPDFINIIIVDKYGSAVIAATTPTQYNYSQSEWWQHITANDTYYVETVQKDFDTNTLTTTLAQPYYNAQNEFIGAIAATYNLNGIIEYIANVEQGNTSFGILTAEAELIPLHLALNTDPVYLPATAIESIQNFNSQATVSIWGSPYLIKSAEIATSDNTYAAPWSFAAYQEANDALKPLNTARNGTIALSSITIVSVTAIVVILTQNLIKPLNTLSEAAEQILQGNRGVNVEVTTKDEFGTLANTFNQMSSEISNMVDNLEKTIEERTKDLERKNIQLEASALVAQQANQIQDLTTLLDETVALISETFGYYHAGIFLLDEQRKYAVLEAANSPGGKRMLARGHKLQVGRVGVVGYCAGMAQPRIAQDVGADITYYDNPDMPHTRSEMALPMIVRDQVIGVVDVQSTEASAFTQDDIEVLQVLANQIALAIEKSRLLESSQNTLEELQRLYGEETALAWKQKLTDEEIAFQYSSTGFTKALSDKQTVQPPGNKLNKEIKYRGQVIGSLDFIRDEVEGRWTEEEDALIEDILEQTALALENARLVDQIKLRSDQITLLQQITAMAASTLDETDLLSQVTNKLQSSLQLNQCGAVLFDTLNESARLTACAPETEITTSKPEISIEEDPFLLDQENAGTEIIVVNEIQETSKYKTFTNSFNVEHSNSLIFVPITFRDAAIGYIYMAEEEIDRKMDAEEYNLYLQIQAQVSTAVESARLFAAEQQGREASAALLEITQISSASLDINEVLNEATYRSAEAIQANRCTILLLDEREKIKPLISVYFDGTQMEEDEWDLLVKDINSSYQPVPMRDLAANLRIPRYIDNPLTYEQFPLGWTHHFNIEKILMVPLISQNKVIGSMVYDLISREKSFTQNQVELAQTIAGQIATTLENANLFDQAVRRAERERQVTEITAKIRASNDPKEILDTAISELRLALAKHEIQEKQKAISTNRTTSGSNGKESN